MRNTTPRRPTEPFNPLPPPPPPARRDSDASFASSRPSFLGIGSLSAVEPYSDRSFQSSALRSVNSFLSSRSLPPLSSKPSQVPSLKEISDTLKSLLSFLHFPSSKLEDDLFLLLKSLNCPFKINKSMLRAPNTPHNWPNCLGFIHWLVQIALYTEHLSKKSSFPANDSMNGYALESYMLYIRGEDDLVEVLDREFMEKFEKERVNVAETLNSLKSKTQELEAKAESLRTGPTDKEALEDKKCGLEEDVNKFHKIIAEFTRLIGEKERVLEEKRVLEELRAKEEERMRICEENDELRKKVELQTFNARDVEKMKRELQAVERDMGEAEVARNSWEDKSWDLDTTIGHKFKEIQALAMECNQATRRLQLGNDFQYLLNAKGSTPAEVMGIDYKSTIKPELEGYGEKVRESYTKTLEGLIAIQQQSKNMATKIEDKKNHIAALQSHIDEVEAQVNLLKKEMQDYAYKCAAEARKMVQEVQIEGHDLDILEREAVEVLKASELKLQDAIKQSEEEIQMHACKLFTLVDSVSKYKEYMESKISEIRTKVSETAIAVSEAYKNFPSAQFGIITDASH